jgi:hypothetical protein
VLKDIPQTHGDMQKFERILEAWNLKISEQRADKQSRTITLVINARYFSQANLVLAIAGTNFKDALINHHADYEPDPPERH